MPNKITPIEQGQVGLVQLSKDGRILQIALSVAQHAQLQLFLGAISQESPLCLMGEDYELELKKKL